jgi:hypothetical protein
MRQSERVVPGRYLTEDERAKSIARFMDWYVNRRCLAQTLVGERAPDERWAQFLRGPQRYKWFRSRGRVKAGGGKRNGR